MRQPGVAMRRLEEVLDNRDCESLVANDSAAHDKPHLTPDVRREGWTDKIVN